jgi:hypothetical protein
MKKIKEICTAGRWPAEPELKSVREGGGTNRTQPVVSSCACAAWEYKIEDSFMQNRVRIALEKDVIDGFKIQQRI